MASEKDNNNKALRFRNMSFILILIRNLTAFV